MAQSKSLVLACDGSADLRDELKDECLKQEIFYSLKEAQVAIGLLQNAVDKFGPHPLRTRPN
jgi:hypothetical protein